MIRTLALALAPAYLALVTLPLAAPPVSAENRIDMQRPDAPELAAYGDLPVGVSTMRFTNPGQIDVAGMEAEWTEGATRPDPLKTVDRELVVEIFYPAADGATGATTHQAAMRDGTVVELTGRSMRDAAPRKGETYPLVMISHGYPGNRFLLSHLAENLASKGYVVASIDHPDSIYRDLGAFGDTLRNRPIDQLFVLQSIADEAGKDGSFLNGLVDADNAGLIGYSMGGYGALIASGAGITEGGSKFPFTNNLALADVHIQGSDTQLKPDARIKTIVLFGPWGRNRGFWDEGGLSQVTIPTLLIAGGQDDVSGYDIGVRKIWEEMKGTDRALLTFEGANHNAGAPMPAPREAVEKAAASGEMAPWDHYGDAVWDNVRMNNVAQHFVTAWLDRHIKNEEAKADYLDLVPDAEEAVFAVTDGKEDPTHTYWKGFPARTAKGLRFERLKAGE